MEGKRSKMSLKARIIIPIICILTLVLIVGIIRIIYDAQNEKKFFILQIKKSENCLKDISNRLASDYLQMAIILAKSPTVKEALFKNDREALLSYAQNIWKELQEYSVYPIKIHFHIPPGKSYLRVWKPQKYGDDLRSFRHTVVQVLNTGKPVKGIEPGRAGLAVRGVVPIFYQGKVIGSVEVFTSLTSVAKELRKVAKEDNALLWIETVKTTVMTEKVKNQIGKYKILLSSKPEEMKLLSEHLLDRAINNPLLLEKGDFLIDLIPVKDYSGKTVGVYVRFKNLAPIKAQVFKNIIIESTVLILGLAIALLIIANIVKISVINPLNKILKETEKVSEGNLKITISPEGSPETQKLAFALNNMVSAIKKFIINMNETTKKVLSVSKELNNESGKLFENSNIVDNAISRLKTLSQEVTNLIENIAHAIDQFTISVQDIAQGVSQTSQGIDKVKKHVDLAVKKIDELAQDSLKIGEMVDVIENIADQTNLLALNATIEAARAGEAGKGFAVVANEVKELAQQTTEATEKIRKIVSLIGSKVKEAVTIVKEVNSTVDQVRDQANQIATASEEQVSVVENIKQNTETGKEKAQLMLEEMLFAEESIQYFLEVANTMTKLQEDLQELAQELKKSTSKFKI